MTLEVVTAPLDAAYETFYPLAQIRKDLVIASTAYDAKLARMLRAAVHVCGQTARCVILPTTLKARFDAPVYQCDCYGILGRLKDKDKTEKGLYLKGPVISITSLTDGTTALTNNTDYELIREEGAKGQGIISWLTNGEPTDSRIANKRLTCVYVAGFSDANPDKPAMVQACFEILAHWYSTPGEINDYSALPIPQSALQILQGFWTSRVNRRHY